MNGFFSRVLRPGGEFKECSFIRSVRALRLTLEGYRSGNLPKIAL